MEVPPPPAREIGMGSASLDEIIAFNEQLSALADAGIPLDLALVGRHRSTAKALKHIQTTVTRRINRGESLEEALEGDEDDVPASYRSLLQQGIRSGDFSEALDGSNRVAELVDETRHTLASAFVYPLILCALAYIGLIGFCLYLVPVWQGMYQSARLSPGPGLRILQTIKDTLPYWVAVPPILLILSLVAWRRRTLHPAAGDSHNGMSVGWLPGASKALFQQRCAHFAATLGELLDASTPLDTAVRIAGDASNDANLRAGSQLMADDIASGGLPSDGSRAASLFPPFLRWAVWHADETTGRSSALQIATRLYREAADRRAKRLRTLAPIAVLVALGGTVTLLYGLALFAPFAELLRSLAT
jgi:type II secretory pathway component PulF